MLVRNKATRIVRFQVISHQEQSLSCKTPLLRLALAGQFVADEFYMLAVQELMQFNSGHEFDRSGVTGPGQSVFFERRQIIIFTIVVCKDSAHVGALFSLPGCVFKLLTSPPYASLVPPSSLIDVMV